MSLKNKLFSIMLAALLILPVGALFAATPQGDVAIEITDENKQPFSGTWLLYQGINEQGMLARNGSSGETFKINEGNYFLAIHPKNPDHKYFKIYSTNPQKVEAGKTTTFKVQYFATEEQLNKVEAALQPAQPTKTLTEQEKKAKEAEEAAKKAAAEAEAKKKAAEEEERMRMEAAAKAREKVGSNDAVNAQKIKAAEEAKKVAEAEAKKKAEAEAEAKRKAEAAARLQQIREAAARRASLNNVPQFNSAPANANSEESKTEQATAATSKAPQLAATGTPGVLALLIPSLLGGMAFRRKQ